MIKLYGIFHLPTGELRLSKIYKNKKSAENQLNKWISELEEHLEIWTDASGKRKLKELNHCEVRELNYKMGGE